MRGGNVMSARIFFMPENSAGLTAADCRVLNTAARAAFPPQTPPPFSYLTKLRTTYRPGMSANDLLNQIEGNTDA